jgi:hypothetical protein
MGFVVDSGAGAGFLRVLRFSLLIRIPPIAPQSPSSIIWGLYNRPEVAAVPSGLSPTPLIIIIIIIIEGLIILKRTLKIWSIDVLYKSILVQNRDHLWAVVNKVMKLLVLNYVENFLTS